MSKSICETVRFEIEEAALGENYGAEVWKHLRECRDCELFEIEQTKLRRLVGSLGTVEAPADFDFKLRARLANQTSSSSNFRWSINPLLATVASLLLFGGLVATVTYVRKPVAPTPVVAVKNQPAVQNPAPAQTPDNPKIDQPSKPSEVVAVDSTHYQKRTERSSAVTFRPKRSLAAADFSSTRASTFGGAGLVSSSTVFPIDASTQPMKFSLDDGRGNAKTISLPGVSFGSQRVLAGNQFAQRGIW